MHPELETVRNYLKDYDIVPVFYEVLCDYHTPIHVFQALKGQNDNCFILESVNNAQQWGRYSFIGIHPKAEIKIKNGRATIDQADNHSEVSIDNPIRFLSGILSRYRTPKFAGAPKLTGGLIGFFGYDTVRYIEKKLCHPPKDDLNLPDCHLFLFDEIIAFDHLSNQLIIIQNIDRKSDAAAQYEACRRRAEELVYTIERYVPQPDRMEDKVAEIEVTSNITKEQYLQNVERAKEYIQNGDLFQIVPSQRLEVRNPPDSFQVYRMLRATNPSPYLYYFRLRDYDIAGASPEMLVSVTDGTVCTRPIAGTIKRGADPAEDLAFERQLLQDPKERAEHTMLVDLGRNDIGKVARLGSVQVTSLMQVERYSKVMHLVSDVQGTLRPDKTALDALMAVLPAGTLSGAPKVRAMEIIDELEPTRRGLYGGTVGYLGFDGNIDTCIAIRTVLFQNDKAYVQAGGGVVADSIPENEYLESRNKAQAVINAMQAAKRIIPAKE